LVDESQINLSSTVAQASRHLRMPCLAIPAAIFAHYFEARITSLFHEIDELLFNLMPQIERYEGRVRISHRFIDDKAAEDTTPESPPATATTAAN
jgi:biopolymer transport protein ExbB